MGTVNLNTVEELHSRFVASLDPRDAVLLSNYVMPLVREVKALQVALLPFAEAWTEEDVPLPEAEAYRRAAEALGG